MTNVGSRRCGSVVAALGLAFVQAACRDAPSLTLPPGAVQFAPHAQYDFWWRTTEACSGLSADMATVRFFVQQGAALSGIGETSIAGEWAPSTRQIFLASTYLDDGPIVRHEMLHALLGNSGGHPALYFQQRCDGIVDCPTACQVDGGLDTLAIHHAPVLALTALTLGGYTIPDTVDLDSNDGWWIAVATVTNATNDSAWVHLQPYAPGPPGPGSTVSEGVGAFAPIDHWYSVVFTPADSVFLAPGQTMHAVIDFNPLTRSFAAGSHFFLPYFNIDTGRPVQFTIVGGPQP